MTLFLGGMGITFALSGRIETTTIDKTALWRSKLTPLRCINKIENRETNDLLAMSVYKRGYEGKSLITLHY